MPHLRKKFTKPRNQLGLIKDMPLVKKKQMLLDTTKIGDSELHRLALRRARGR